MGEEPTVATTTRRAAHPDEVRVLSPGDLIGVRDLAAMIGRSPMTALRWVNTGRVRILTQLDGPTGQIIMDRSEVLEDLERMKREEQAA